MLNDNKTYAVITSAKHRPTIETLLPPGSILYVEDNPDIKSILAAIYRRNIDIVIIDDDGLPYKPENEADIYAFPAMQTGSHRTRVIFIPSTERTTGDPFLSNLVSVGIYDIMDPCSQEFEKDLEKYVDSPSAFANAVKWFNPDLLPDETASRKRNKDKQQTGKRLGIFGRKNQKEEETPPSAFDAAEAAITVPEKPSALEDVVSSVGKTPLEQLKEQFANGDVASIPEVEAAESVQEETNEPAQPTENPTGPIPGKRIAPKKSTAPAPEPEQVKQDKPVPPSGSLGEAINEVVTSSATSGMVIERDEEGLPVIPASTIDVLVEQVTERIGEELMAEIEKRTEQQNRAKDLGTRTIAIASLESGAGATHLALATVQFLASRIKGQKIGCALCDASELNSMSMLLRGGKSAQGQPFKARGVFYALLGDKSLEDMQWLVEDCGVLTNKESLAHTAFSVAALKCVVIQGDPWKAHQNSKAIEKFTVSDMSGWTWCFRNASEDYANKFLAKACPEGKGAPAHFMIPADDGSWWTGKAPDMSEMLGKILPAKYRHPKPNQQNKQQQKNSQNSEKKSRNTQAKQEQRPEQADATPSREEVQTDEQRPAEPTAQPEENKEPAQEDKQAVETEQVAEPATAAAAF